MLFCNFNIHTYKRIVYYSDLSQIRSVMYLIVSLLVIPNQIVINVISVGCLHVWFPHLYVLCEFFFGSQFLFQCSTFKVYLIK